MTDLATEAFIFLRNYFFNINGEPKPFSLRPKENTQDDPFDELLVTEVFKNPIDFRCQKASGPLVTPDMVLFRSQFCTGVDANELTNDINRILAIEVKKLERTKQGGVARASGLDYNTTPPCGKVRVYDSRGEILDIRSFYLFVCLEQFESDKNQVILTALALVDGDVLNTDFEFYLSIVGERKKKINLGSYADGADRARPMLIFSNPLGSDKLDHNVSLVHPVMDLEYTSPNLRLVYVIERFTTLGDKNSFYCYRFRRDVPDGWVIRTLKEPFPTPKRDTRTRPRGRFMLPFRVR